MHYSQWWLKCLKNDTFCLLCTPNSEPKNSNLYSEEHNIYKREHARFTCKKRNAIMHSDNIVFFFFFWNNRFTLTYPNWSRWLLVILHFWKVIICFSQDAPVAGLSGWTKSLPFSEPIGSALPVTTHSESWNLYLLSPTGTISITTAYSASGSRPDMLTFTTGNILLQERESILVQLAVRVVEKIVQLLQYPKLV